jgi:DNA-binding PadR family transcriptional regulator
MEHHTHEHPGDPTSHDPGGLPGHRHRSPEGPFGRRFARGGRGAPGGPWFGGPRFGGRRARGDVRAAILVLLAEQPMHGYQIMQEIGERSGGRWEPSPGSVYPTLQALQDGGFVQATETDGKRVYELTDAGRAEAAAAGERDRDPWDIEGDDRSVRALAEEMASLGHAFRQVIRAGTPDQHERARTALAEARRSLYQILAEDPAS